MHHKELPYGIGYPRSVGLDADATNQTDPNTYGDDDEGRSGLVLHLRHRLAIKQGLERSDQARKI